MLNNLKGSKWSFSNINVLFGKNEKSVHLIYLIYNLFSVVLKRTQRPLGYAKKKKPQFKGTWWNAWTECGDEDEEEWCGVREDEEEQGLRHIIR